MPLCVWDSSDERRLFSLNDAKFVQASSGPHAVCLATEGGIFHSVPSPERAAFLPVLFYRHRWKWVTAVRVTVSLSGKYWCICKRMLICTFYWQSSPRGAYLGQDGALIYPRAANFLSAPPQLWHKSADLHEQCRQCCCQDVHTFCFFFLFFFDVRSSCADTTLGLTEVELKLTVDSSALSLTVITACQCHL